MNIDTIFKEIAKGRDLTPEELLSLIVTEGHGVEIREFADTLNREMNGDVVTFVHNRNINYTNICKHRCLFCAFRRSSGDPDSYVLSIEDILKKIAATPGITEVCIQGGLLPGVSFSFILDMLREIKRAYPRIHIHAFSPMEIRYISDISGRGIRSVISALIECGLGSMPGTAAEILDDRIRQVICPEKLRTEDWVSIVTTAHRLDLRSTATILIGHIETAGQIVKHMEIIRDIQKKTGGFTEFIPLIFVPYTTPLGKRFGIGEMLTFAKVLKFYALARIFFNGLIPNVQASWPKLGFEDAMRTLSVGVNDLGGTLYEENITSKAGGTYGQEVSVNRFKEGILGIGKIPQERDTLYNFLPHAGVAQERMANGELLQESTEYQITSAPLDRQPPGTCRLT